MVYKMEVRQWKNYRRLSMTTANPESLMIYYTDSHKLYFYPKDSMPRFVKSLKALRREIHARDVSPTAT